LSLRLVRSQRLTLSPVFHPQDDTCQIRAG
jgi:hypothetical protein